MWTCCCRISYCSADATYDHVFDFIATNKNNTMECHAFLCKKRKMVNTTSNCLLFKLNVQAQSATLTIAQAFNLAYSYWQVLRLVWRAASWMHCPNMQHLE